MEAHRVLRKDRLGRGGGGVARYVRAAGVHGAHLGMGQEPRETSGVRIKERREIGDFRVSLLQAAWPGRTSG